MYVCNYCVHVLFSNESLLKHIVLDLQICLESYASCGWFSTFRDLINSQKTFGGCPMHKFPESVCDMS